MPAAFDRCVKNGGKIRTVSLGKDKYMHVCFPKGGGSSVSGEEKVKKSYNPKKGRSQK